MIAKDKRLRKICKEYEKVENYAEAVADKTQMWDLHHRNGAKMPREELERLGLYFNRPPGELMFLKHTEHSRLHDLNMSEENRNKLATAFKGKHHTEETKIKLSKELAGHNNGMFGKQHNEETRKKISEITKSKMSSKDIKDKISKARIGAHWWNNGKEEILAKEQPTVDFTRGRLKSNKIN